MIIVNDKEFDNFDITAAALELTELLTETQKTELITFLINEWPVEAEQAASIMVHEGLHSLQLGHIADSVSEDNGQAFINSIQEFMNRV